MSDEVNTAKTSTNILAACTGMIISFLSVSIYAQSAGAELNRFAADVISFHYPAGYSVKEESTPEAQQFVINRKGSSVRVTVIVLRHPVLRDELPAAIEDLRESLLKNVAVTLGAGKNSTERTPFQTQIGTKQAEGIRLRSKRTGTKTGEVMWVRLSLRLIGFAYVRSDADESVGSELWRTLISTLRVEPPTVATMTPGDERTENEKSEVLNGKALALPKPAYPALARAAHVSGTVTVQVLIDEQGNVSAAHAVDGHPLLQPVCVAAARQARFSPTLLEGEPVKVAGVIKYSFIPQ